MAIYFGVYAYLALLAISCKYVFKKNIQKRKTYVTIGCFIVIFLLIALRHPSMGIDLHYGKSYGYIHAFHQLAGMSWKDVLSLDSFLNYEKGYVILNKLIAVIYPNTQFYLAVVAFFSLTPIFYYVGKQSVSPIYSTVIYMGLQLFLLQYSGLRQCIAVGLCLIAVDFIRGRKPIKFILLVLFSCLFHSTSIVFLLAYPIYHIKMNFQIRIVSFVFLPIIWILKKPIFLFLTGLFGFTPKIDNNNAITLFLVLCMVYLFCCFFVPKDENGSLNLFFVACCIQAMAGLQSNMIRAGYSYLILLIVLLPNTIYSIQSKKTRFFVNLIVIPAFIAFGLYSIYTNEWAMAYPYIPHWKFV